MAENTIQEKYIIDTTTNKTLHVHNITLPNNLTPQQWNLRQNISTCNLFTTPQLKLLDYIIDHVNETGLVILSPNEVYKTTHIPATTISRILTKLQDEQPPILIKKASLTYQINPLYVTDYSKTSNIDGILYTST